jgi:hypothetical protein
MEGKRNPCIDAARAELEANGIRNFILVHGSKHPQLRWSINGHPLRILTLPGSTSDWRSPRNVRRDVRALLRLDGLIETRGPGPRSSEARPRSRSPTTPAKIRGPERTPKMPSARHGRWRERIEALARSLKGVNIPQQQLMGERDGIIAALRQLSDRTIERSEP